MVPISRQLSETIREIAQRLQPLDDAELLRRVAQQRDEAAFAELVQRHGPMVLGVCRRLLGRIHEAEDVFQATFLTLFRKVGEIRQPQYLSTWLYRVAWNIATKQRSRKMPHAPDTRIADQTDPYASMEWAELRGVLDDELNRLPDRIRAALVLCYLEGMTRDQAAKQLNISRRTLLRLLEEGRETIKNRLDQRGLRTVPFALAVLEGTNLCAMVSTDLLQKTVQLTQGTISPTVTHLLALNASWFGSTKTLVSLSLLLVTCGWFFLSMHATDNKGATKNGLNVEKNTNNFDGPLPEGALYRFGTKAYRIGDTFWFGNCSADGRWMVSAHLGTVLWDLQNGSSRPIAELRNNRVPRPTISPDGKTIAILDGGLGVRIHDAQSGKEIQWLENKLEITNLQFRQDSKQLICITKVPGDRTPKANDGESKILVLDWQTGKRIHENDAPQSIMFRSHINNQNYLLGISTNKTNTRLVLVDPTNAKQVGEFTLPNLFVQDFGFQFQATQTWTMDPEQKRAAYLDDKYNLVVWDLVNSKAIHTFRIPKIENGWQNTPSQLLFSPDGKQLLIQDTLAGLYRLDLKTLELMTLCPIRSMNNHFNIFAIDDKSQTVITAGGEGVISRRDLMTGQEYPSGDGYCRDLHAYQSPDGKWLVMCEEFGKIDLIEMATGNRMKRFDTAEFREPSKTKLDVDRLLEGFQRNHCAFTPDGKTLALAHGHAILLWDLQKQQIRKTIDNSGFRIANASYGISNMYVSPNSQLLLVASTFGQTRVFDLQTGERKWESSEHKTGTNNFDRWVGFSKDNRTVIRSNFFWENETTRLSLIRQDAQTGAELQKQIISEAPSAKSSDVRTTCLSPDGRLIALILRNGQIQLLDALSFKKIAAWEKTFHHVGALAFSPNGWMLAFVDEHGLLRVHDTFGGKEIWTRPGHVSTANRVEFSRAGDRILTACGDGLAYLWDSRVAGSLKETWWEDLKSTDPKQAYQTVCALIKQPDAVERLRTEVARLPEPDLPNIQEAIEKLNHPRFMIRERASQTLKKAGRNAEAALAKALENKPSDEVRRRIEEILAERTWIPTPEEVRLLHAIQILEAIGSMEAKQVLQQWAKINKLGWLGQEAETASQRLK